MLVLGEALAQLLLYELRVVASSYSTGSRAVVTNTVRTRSDPQKEKGPVVQGDYCTYTCTGTLPPEKGHQYFQACKKCLCTVLCYSNTVLYETSFIYEPTYDTLGSEIYSR